MNTPGSLSRYYHFAATVPAAVSFLGMIIYTVIDSIQSKAGGYESEYMTADAMAPLAVAMAVINAVIVCLLCISIFLNKIDLVRENAIPCFLSWFLAPFIYLGYVLNQMSDAALLSAENIFFLILTLPYATGLLASFILYRLKQNAPATM